MLRFDQLAAITGGRVLSRPQNPSIEHLLLDSRKLTVPATSLFFAIRGERHDGHRFIAELYGKGVRQFVVEKPLSSAEALEVTAASILQVSDSVRALQAVAAYHRRQFSIPVVGITGSNGKTIVKEWLTTLLNEQFNIAKSPKSYNSQVGVPLSVWEMNEAHTLAIFEAGLSKPGEMAHLEPIIQPTIGIFTNIGPAHDEGFRSREQKIREKALLFTRCPTVVCCRDHEAVHKVLTTSLPPAVRLFTWARNREADVQVQQVEVARESRLVIYFKETFTLTVPFSDEASLENVMHCVTVMLLLGIAPPAIQARLALLQPVSMRLELKEALYDCYLIDDSYNNDLAGLTIALDFLNGQGIQKNKTVILSDVLESGLPETELYGRIARLLHSKGIRRLIGIGETISRNKDLFTGERQFFSSAEAYLSHSPSFRNELILVKGARAFRFERIVQRLQRKTHGTVLEINLDALASNLNYFRSKLRPDTKVMVMVKAFSYGSGSAEVAGLLQFHRVDYLAVAYADEGVALREKGISLPIMVMNPSADSFGQLLDYKLEPEVYSFKILGEFLAYLRQTAQIAKIHVKIDTGMHRLGFTGTDIAGLLRLVQENPAVRVASVFSHLAAADEPQWREFTLQQIALFEQLSGQITATLGYPLIRHISNTAGIVNYTPYQFDMVRLGGGLYGVSATPDEQARLAPASTLKTVISQIKPLQAGQSVGYGRHGKITSDTTVATIAIGYADGFDRRFSRGNGRVWVNGYFAPTIGNVSMDMTMIDVTGIPAREGDEVIIFGPQLPLTELATRAGTIPYEIMTGISERVKRVFYTG